MKRRDFTRREMTETFAVTKVQWQDVEDSAGVVRDAAKAVLSLLPGIKAGRIFLRQYADEDGKISSDKVILCEDVMALSERLDKEKGDKLARIIRLIRAYVSFILQFDKYLEGRTHRTFNECKYYYKQIRDLGFFADKKFFTMWIDSCKSRGQYKEVFVGALKDGIFLNEKLGSLIEKYCGDAEMGEILVLAKGDFSKAKMIIDAYDGASGKRADLLIGDAFSKCLSDADFDWMLSLTREIGFSITPEFLVECMKRSKNGMNQRVALHTLHLRTLSGRPSKEFFDAWMGNISGDMERGLVEKYAAARR
jgi:hypothetical protein